MNKPDARFLDPSTQNYLRQQAIRLREQGRRFIDIAAYLGVHRNTVAQWWQQYKQCGESAFKQRVRGVKYGEWRTLSPGEEEKVPELMLAHFPDELEIDSALWTRIAVQALIAQQYGVEMPIRTVGEYLKRWGFTPQKPLRRADSQDEKLVETWLNSEYPAIQQCAWRRRRRKLLGAMNREYVLTLKWVEAMRPEEKHLKFD